MDDQHICQLNADKAFQLTNELRKVVRQLQASDRPKKRPFAVKKIPDDQKKKSPKFAPDRNRIPVICFSSTLDVRFTSDQKTDQYQNEYSEVIYAKINRAGNPYKSSGDLIDPKCDEDECASTGRDVRCTCNDRTDRRTWRCPVHGEMRSSRHNLVPNSPYH